MKKLISLLLALVLVFTLAACDAKESTPAAASFKVVVTDLEGSETTFEYTSSAASVGEALVAEGLISGHETEYGLYIDTVNGITADWDADQTYWAFYINGEYATTGIDGTAIVADTTYGLVLTKG
ncbi:MAG: DUF4430 domain-containing protein [Oscillospiraceae bacterium]|nr:DUF4430 domain-containing protein [Oscillospiraceae bacterium]MBR2423081.1 DUF4430 domain-containing protein [Oscillospiraceae bacterium]